MIEGIRPILQVEDELANTEDMAELLEFDKLLDAFTAARIATGKAIAATAGLITVHKPHRSKNQQLLHDKAVAKRNKRKNGGHK